MRALATFGGAPLASHALLALLPSEPSPRAVDGKAVDDEATAADEQVALA
jgi:hypothetical protein